MDYAIAFIGAGNIGMAILSHALSRGTLEASRVLVADLDEQRREEASAFGCDVTSDTSSAGSISTLFLAVKPQGFDPVAAALGVRDDARLIISVMAGIGSERMATAFGPGARIVRAMPNTPAWLGEGMTAIAAGLGATLEDMHCAREIFSSVGHVIEVDEPQLHAVTAVSGSGPAWIFRVAEACEKAAVEAGLSATQAAELVRYTIRGAGMLLTESREDPADLRRAVTTTGGTTAAGMDVMRERDLDGLFRDAIQAACKRSVELGEGS